MIPNFAETLPAEFVANTVAICGDRGRQWLDNLPHLIVQLEREWDIKAEPCFSGIEYNYVSPATLIGGGDVVLKLGIPQKDIEIYSEAKYLRTLNGLSAVRLIREDRDRQAILVERAMPGSSLNAAFAGDPFAAVDKAAELLLKITEPAPKDRSDTVSLDDWFDNLRRARGTEFEAPAQKALDIYEIFSRHAGRIGYLHGDYHPGNIVLSGERFVVIDPKGIVGHIGYETGSFLLNLYRWQADNPGVAGVLDHAIKSFAKTLRMIEKEIRQWAYAQTVLSAWWTFDEMPDLYDDEVAKADVWDV